MESAGPNWSYYGDLENHKCALLNSFRGFSAPFLQLKHLLLRSKLFFLHFTKVPISSESGAYLSISATENCLRHNERKREYSKAFKAQLFRTIFFSPLFKLSCPLTTDFLYFRNLHLTGPLICFNSWQLEFSEDVRA